MSDYFTLKVKDVIQETEDAVTIQFKQPIFNKIKYESGQFLTVIIPINGEKIRRSYSMSSTPNLDSHIAVTVKRVKDGLISNYLNETLKKGNSMELMKPMGNFTLPVDKKAERHIILFGGGSGITPLMSILRSILFFEPNSKVSLVYANQDEQSIIFKDKLVELQEKFSDRFTVVHILETPQQIWQGYKGRADQPMLTNIINLLPKYDPTKTEHYICGPTGMMEVVKESLKSIRIKPDKIHIESFVSTAPTPQVDTSGLQSHEVTIILNGTEHKVTVPPNKTILDAGLDDGLDMPFSCQSGLCTACMGKCTSGEIKMSSNDALSNDELEEGFRLLCVGHPTGEGVVVEVD
ncbi:MAG: ring-1,2-phenylacetyl-CoA epoxidase subunit PaaE [Flammeovirgaceae bacterium]|jgi:ring-1,2-phenylacetyl-CoA epoxidase subunit PaaE